MYLTLNGSTKLFLTKSIGLKYAQDDMSPTVTP